MSFFCYDTKELVPTINIQLIYNKQDKKSISLEK